MPKPIACSARRVQLIHQHNYYLDGSMKWRDEPDLYVLSNGDTLGPSYHADFINGVRS